jgi:hypothetical protein
VVAFSRGAKQSKAKQSGAKAFQLFRLAPFSLPGESGNGPRRRDERGKAGGVKTGCPAAAELSARASPEKARPSLRFRAIPSTQRERRQGSLKKLPLFWTVKPVQESVAMLLARGGHLTGG